MYNYNDELAYQHSLRNLAKLRKQAELQHKLSAPNIHRRTYRSRLAQNLQRLANWLEPTPKGGRYVSE